MSLYIFLACMLELITLMFLRRDFKITSDSMLDLGVLNDLRFCLATFMKVEFDRWLVIFVTTSQNLGVFGFIIFDFFGANTAKL